MPSPNKTVTATCTNVKLLPDGRQQVSLEKSPAFPTSTTPGGPTTVSMPEFTATFITTDPNEGVYLTGKTYQVNIIG
jgi:hypothetical protein